MLPILLKSDNDQEYFELRDHLMNKTIEFSNVISNFNNNSQPIIKSYMREKSIEDNRNKNKHGFSLRGSSFRGVSRNGSKWQVG